MERVTTNDVFGNKIEFTEISDSHLKKLTITNRLTKFNFLTDIYCIGLLSGAETIKIYSESNHSQFSLVRDKYGRMFYYRYEEEMNFYDGPDREDESWTLVQNEADADTLSLSSKWSALREPFVCADEKGWVAAHEIIDRTELEKNR